jgi:hypothetical protein
MLLKYGAKVTARDSLGRPLLVIAINASAERFHSSAYYARILSDLLNHGAAEDPLVLPYTQQVIAQQITIIRLFHDISSVPVPPAS